MKEYGPHFNEPLSRPPELSWNLKTDRRSVEIEISEKVPRDVIKSFLLKQKSIIF
jgi:hypothetical protein